MSDFPLLPMQKVMFCEDLHRGLTAIRSRRPNILHQGHHGIRRQLVDLDLEPPQDLHHESMCRKTKASGEKSLKTTNSPSGSGTSSAPGTRPTPLPKYPSCCISCTRTEDIRDTPNFTVSPGCNSSTSMLLKVSSNDVPAGCVSAADEEEDGMATYRRRRRAVCLTWARSPMSRSKEGKRAGERFPKAARVSRRAERVPGPRRPAPLFIHRTRRFRKPAVQQYRVHQRSHQNPPRNHFERGQRLHHLATSSALDDLVELVPRRAHVGTKAKTLPFARCLRQSRCNNGSKATDSLHPSSDKLQDEGLRRGRPVLCCRPT
jgi:hypothetical protein